MQIISIGDYPQIISKCFLGKIRQIFQYIVYQKFYNMSSTENFTQYAKHLEIKTPLGIVWSVCTMFAQTWHVWVFNLYHSQQIQQTS